VTEVLQIGVLTCSGHVRESGHEYHCIDSGYAVTLQCLGCHKNSLFRKKFFSQKEIRTLTDPNLLSSINSGDVYPYFEDPVLFADIIARVLKMYGHVRSTGHKVTLTGSSGLRCTQCDLRVHWDYGLGMPRHLAVALWSAKTFEDILFSVPEFRERVVKLPSRFARLL